MIDDKIRDLIKKREETHPEDFYAAEKVWKEEVDLLVSDIEGTIEFIRERCTADEFAWLSEVFDEVAERTKSSEFIDSLYYAAQKYPEETIEYNIISFIESAKNLVG